MNINTLTSSHVQHLLDLTKRRESVATELAHIESQIAAIYGNGQSTTSAPATSAEPAPRRRGPGRRPGITASAAPARRGRKPGSTRRGTLKEKIMSILRSAGSKGLRVREVAEQIGAKKDAVNVWFYTTGKNVPGLKKIAPGTFSLKA